MPRSDISAANQAQLALDGVRPVYMVYLGFDLGGGAPWRMTSYSDDLTQTPESDVWTANGVRVSGIDYNSPASRCSLSLPNTDKSVLSLVQAQGLGQVAQVYMTWLPDGTTTTVATADMMWKFNGIIGSGQFGSTARLDCMAIGAHRRVPYVRVTSLWANWLVPVGTSFTWGNNITVVLEE